MHVNWHELFVPSGSLAEIVIRGTVIYLALFLAMRFLPRRTIGTMGPSDLLVVVIIADAVQNGMAGEYRSITEAVVLAVTIFGWATVIDWLDFKFPHWHLAEAPPMELVKNGKLVRENMERHLVTEEEVLAQLRLHGQESPASVARACLEGDGHISVILRQKGEEQQSPPGQRHV
jgi:uncharacterized membrane protein YcaP (DUF421 family)